MKFEYKILNMFKKRKSKDVLEVLRSGGSHSLFDLVVFTDKGVRLIQAKIDGYLKKDERKGLIEFFERIKDKNFYNFIQFEVWYYISKKKKKKKILKAFGNDDFEKVVERINSMNKKISTVTEHINGKEYER